jgi:hypothetical protein
VTSRAVGRWSSGEQLRLAGWPRPSFGARRDRSQRGSGNARPSSRPDHTRIGLEWLAATAGLPVAAPVAGGVQARAPAVYRIVMPSMRRALHSPRRPGPTRCDLAAAYPPDHGARRSVTMFSSRRAGGRRVFVAGRAEKRFCSSRCRLWAIRRAQRMTPIDYARASIARIHSGKSPSC